MLLKLLSPVLISIGIYFAIALGLILSQKPRPLEAAAGLDFDRILASPLETPQDPAFQRTSYKMRDGTALDVTRVAEPGAETRPLVVMVHGSGWHGGQFDQLAWALRDVAEVRAITLRGHGADPVRRGDVDYIGQLEDDLADLMADAKGRKIILMGHSSGGGLVIRFAGGEHGALIDRAVLLAPFLKYNAPTMRDNSGGWTVPLSRRLAGLSMLNMARITGLNHLTVIQFNMPQQVRDGAQGHMATLAYSFRLNASYAPRNDYLADIAKLPAFTLIAGRADEAFQAAQYELTMAPANPKGRYLMLDGVGHLDVVNAPETEAAIKEILSEF